MGYLALIDPSVLDLREQCPALDRTRMAKYLDDPARRIARIDVPTFDLLLTRLDSRSPRGYSYEAVSVKYKDDLGKPDVLRRIDRDEVFCRSFGWRWTLHTEEEAPRRRVETARKLCLMAANLDLDALREKCLKMAPRLIARCDGRTLDQVCINLGRSLGEDASRMRPLIAAMALHGFIDVDLDQEFDRSSPLVLAR